MATAAKKNTYAYAPSRVYSYSRAAVAETLPEYEPETQPAQIPRPERPAQHPGQRTRVKREPSPAAKRKQRLIPKILSVFAIFLAAAMLIFVVIRYSSITAEWAQVNELSAQIADSNRHIAELQVQLDAAADLDAARETAGSHGLGYPTAEQIIDVEGPASQPAGE